MKIEEKSWGKWLGQLLAAVLFLSILPNWISNGTQAWAESTGKSFLELLSAIFTSTNVLATLMTMGIVALIAIPVGVWMRNERLKDIATAKAEGDAAGYARGMDEGYNKGYGEGAKMGVDAGVIEGRLKGEPIGFAKGEAQGYEKGKTDGHAAGYKEGELIGIERGKERGFEAGKTRGFVLGKDAGIEIGQMEGKEIGLKEGLEKGAALAKDQAYHLGYEEAKAAYQEVEFKKGYIAGKDEGVRSAQPKNVWGEYQRIVDALVNQHDALQSVASEFRSYKCNLGTTSDKVDLTEPMARIWNRMIEWRLTGIFKGSFVTEQDMRLIMHDLNEFNNAVYTYTLITKRLANHAAVSRLLDEPADMDTQRIHEIAEMWARAIEPIGVAVKAWNKLNHTKSQFVWGFTNNERLFR